MVYMILGTGFEPMEAIAPCDILRRGGVEVQLAGIGGTLIEAGHGVRVQADCRVEDLKLASTDMVILPGGLGGVHSILACDTAMNFIRLAYADGKYIAAICAAPTILAQLHITDGRKATCYPGLEEKMGAAVMTACGAVQDGRVITGRAAGSADDTWLNRTPTPARTNRRPSRTRWKKVWKSFRSMSCWRRSRTIWPASTR